MFFTYLACTSVNRQHLPLLYLLSLHWLPTLPVCGNSPSPKAPLLGSQVQPRPYFSPPTCTTHPDFVKTLSKLSLIQVPYFQIPRLPGVGALSRSAASGMPASGPPPPFLPQFTLKDDFRATFPKESQRCDPPLKVRHTTQNKICFQDWDQLLGPSLSQLQSDFNVHPRTWSQGTGHPNWVCTYCSHFVRVVTCAQHTLLYRPQSSAQTPPSLSSISGINSPTRYLIQQTCFCICRLSFLGMPHNVFMRIPSWLSSLKDLVLFLTKATLRILSHAPGARELLLASSSPWHLLVNPPPPTSSPIRN